MIVVRILSGDYVSDETFYSFSRARVWDSLLGTLLGTVFLLSSSSVSSSLSFIFSGLSADFTTALLPFIDTLLLLSVVSSAVFVCSKHCDYEDEDEYDDGDEHEDEDEDEDKDDDEGEYVVSVSLSCLPASVSLPSVLISSFSDNLSSSGPLFSTLGNVTSIIPVSGIWRCSLPPSASPVDAALFPTKSSFLGRVSIGVSSTTLSLSLSSCSTSASFLSPNVSPTPFSGAFVPSCFEAICSSFCKPLATLWLESSDLLLFADAFSSCHNGKTVL
jgi:hypothetical protein